MPNLFPPLYAILDLACVTNAESPIPEMLAEAGVTLFQIRDKHAAAREVFDASRRLVDQLGARGVRVIVNDRPDIAAMTGAGGVHVGQEDLPVEEAGKIVGTRRWVGVSTHNIEQFRLASSTSADYIAVGPIFSTVTKANPDPVVGIEFLQTVRKLTTKPLVAIGGITIESAQSVFRAGADSVAVVSDLLQARDPAKRAQEYFEIAAHARSQGNC